MLQASPSCEKQLQSHSWLSLWAVTGTVQSVDSSEAPCQTHPPCRQWAFQEAVSEDIKHDLWVGVRTTDILGFKQANHWNNSFINVLVFSEWI